MKIHHNNFLQNVWLGYFALGCTVLIAFLFIVCSYLELECVCACVCVFLCIVSVTVRQITYRLQSPIGVIQELQSI